ncbi:MAG: ankyrin repeat domain-containing protein [Candidatus Dependentiae bacterium]|nr:ankyrin repeat domain-containing protein [Candidatus Dependentiae bacterium]
MNNVFKNIQFGLIFLTAIVILQDQSNAQKENENEQEVVQNLDGQDTSAIKKKELPLHDIIFFNQSYTIEESLDLMKDILDKGLQDINAQDANGKTALNLVAFLNCNPKLAQFLIDFKAKVNEPDLFNETPLHNAIKKEEVEIAQILLDAGADLYEKNDQGITPIDLAKRSENMKAIVELEAKTQNSQEEKEAA